MPDTPLLSLCIPTNGVIEWVFPVLDSIFKQNVNRDEYEVIVTDNGTNQEFKNIMREQYVSRYENLVYKETEAQLFLNQIEAFRCARGELIKFVNHRSCLIGGAVEKLILFIKENMKEKPIIYFSNGALLHLDQQVFNYPTFDQFVKDLSYWSSWSAGIAIWKRDFDKLPNEMSFNYFFPHTAVLFQIRDREKYIIDNTVIMVDIPVGGISKGVYDLFYAFGAEYPEILLDLQRDGDISLETFLYIKEENLKFLASLYYDFMIRKKNCSYDLSSYKESIRIFYSHSQILVQVAALIVERISNKIRCIFRRPLTHS